MFLDIDIHCWCQSNEKLSHGKPQLTFRYQVGVGQNTALLAATAINLSGATVQDNGGMPPTCC